MFESVLFVALLLSSLTVTQTADNCYYSNYLSYINARLTDSKSVIGVYCEKFSSTKCYNSRKWTEDDDGFVASTSYPCVKAEEPEQYAESINVIMFVNIVKINKKTKYYLETNSERTGIFLSQDFDTKYKYEDGKDTEFLALVTAVIPQTLPVTGDAKEVTKKCFCGDVECVDKTFDSDVNVYCKLSVTCADAKRGCDDSLVIRTTTALYQDVLADDSAEIGVINSFTFLKKGDETILTCSPNTAGDYKWFDNGELNADETGAKYTYEHTSGKDTIIQCINNKKNNVWNVYTVQAYTQTAVSEATEQVVYEDEESTFKCTVGTSATSAWPSPAAAWYWEDKDEETEDTQLETSFPISKVQEENGAFVYSYTTEKLAYSKDGNFKCYLVNGLNTGITADGILSAWYLTEFKVKTLVHLNSTPVHWYEYNRTSHASDSNHAGTVYYVKDDTVKFGCDVEKETEKHIWWLIDETYYRQSDTTDVLEELDTTKGDTLTLKSADTVWTAKTVDIDEETHNGYHLNQTIYSEHYLQVLTESKRFEVMCFIITASGITSYNLLKAATPDQDMVYKKLVVEVFPTILDPTVRGPIGNIQEEKATITMNCYNSGIPPPYIYWLFVPTSNTNMSINITEKLTAETISETKYHRYRNYRLSAEKDVLIIISLVDGDDEGRFTCYAINRATGEVEPAKGPSPEVVIEEKCAEGAKYCFNSATRLNHALFPLFLLLLPYLWNMLS